MSPSSARPAPRQTGAASRPSGLPRAGLDSTDDHTDLYLALVETPSISRDELLVRGFAGEHIDRVMRAFVNRGLARALGPDTWEALPPDIALPAFASRLEEFASTIRASTASLSRSYAVRHGDKPDPSGYDRLAGVDEISTATQQIIGLASTTAIGLRNNSGYTRHLIDLPMRAHQQPMRNERGTILQVRTTFETRVLGAPHARDVLRARERVGEQHRYLPYLPFSATVTDRGMAVVDIDGPEGEIFGLLISTPEAAKAIDNVAEWAWQLGSAWVIGSDDDTSGLDPRDRRILEHLAIGTTDSIIARRLGVSQRTVERRVRDLLHRLGAETRFQAGVLAAKNGLI